MTNDVAYRLGRRAIGPVLAPTPRCDLTDEEREARVNAHAERIARERPDQVGDPGPDAGGRGRSQRPRGEVLWEVLCYIADRGPIRFRDIRAIFQGAQSSAPRIARHCWFQRIGPKGSLCVRYTLSAAGWKALEELRRGSR
jgi:hypothetical protein